MFGPEVAQHARPEAFHATARTAHIKSIGYFHNAFTNIFVRTDGFLKLAQPGNGTLFRAAPGQSFEKCPTFLSIGTDRAKQCRHGSKLSVASRFAAPK